MLSLIRGVISLIRVIGLMQRMADNFIHGFRDRGHVKCTFLISCELCCGSWTTINHNREDSKDKGKSREVKIFIQKRELKLATEKKYLLQRRSSGWDVCAYFTFCFCPCISKECHGNPSYFRIFCRDIDTKLPDENTNYTIENDTSYFVWHIQITIAIFQTHQRWGTYYP